MDSTVIQEIANQLGIAVDDASAFIQQYLPQYANLHIFYNIMWMILCVVIACITVKVGRILFIRDRDDNYGDFCSVIIFICTSIVVICIIIFIIAVGNAVGWVAFPEARLIDTVFDCIKE